MTINSRRYDNGRADALVSSYFLLRADTLIILQVRLVLAVFGLYVHTAGYCEYSQSFEILYCGYRRARSIFGVQ